MKRATKRILDEAFQRRAALIGVLKVCKCTHPLPEYGTKNLHAEGCPANYILRSMMIADARRRGMVELADRIATLVGNHCAINCECRFIEQQAGPHCPLDCACRFVDAALDGVARPEQLKLGGA